MKLAIKIKNAWGRANNLQKAAIVVGSLMILGIFGKPAQQPQAQPQEQIQAIEVEPVKPDYAQLVDRFLANIPQAQQKAAIEAYRSAFSDQKSSDRDILESLHDACAAGAATNTPDAQLNQHNTIAQKYLCNQQSAAPTAQLVSARREPAKPQVGSKNGNVVKVYGAKTKVRLTASAKLSDGNWFYEGRDRCWIHGCGTVR